ncbi:helix-turn-helix transcriptional regulator [Actinomycetospora sp. NBRC 106375]|uniref:helix-turn-helix domain-containing protein n=1 Tax=Actinomycetospora sp. NBRC 106375 TaxID=3032207 RepID=UPI0025522CC7|nr:helix-turn-helix transcriptional regulator [Actinomycetospora sp. NBRC 106375]
MAERSFGPVVVRRRLGSELRRLRDRAGMSLDQVARELEVSPSKISRLENGQSPAKVWDVRNLLTLYGVEDEDYRRRAERWVNEGKSQGWWHPYSDASPADLDHYVSLEAEAAELRSYCSPYLHGLLQTREYAGALIRAMMSDLDDAAIEGLITVRIGRQAILDQPDPPELHIVVDESVLQRPVGSAALMRAQYEHLADMATRFDVRVRLLDAPPHSALLSPFTVFLPREREIDPTVVNLESAFHDAYFYDADDVNPFLASFNDLQLSSLSPEESAGLLRRLADRAVHKRGDV